MLCNVRWPSSPRAAQRTWMVMPPGLSRPLEEELVMRSCAVSLVEVLIALVLLGIVAALTIPHLGQAATRPDEGLVLHEDLQILRVAIERYYQDHHAYPGAQGDGENAGGTAAAFANQLTRYTDDAGHASEIRNATHRFGPYLRDGIPPCPVAPRLGMAGVHVEGDAMAPRFVPDDPNAGWSYNCETGQITANSNQGDGAGREYQNY